jgi:two-component system LytT family sensor kinase
MSGSSRSPSTIASLAVVCGCLALGGIGALEARHVSVTHGAPLDWITILVSTMPRWIGLAIAMPLALWVATAVPLTPLRNRVVALHIALFLAISFLHAALDTWSVGFVTPVVRLVFPLVPRLMRSWYSTMPTVVTTYAAVLLGAWGTAEAQERQRRTLRASQLEAQLQTARLAALRAQLQPHFLYNTLNAIAALVADVQPARAVSAIEQLSELLHASLRDDGREEIRIDEEVMLVERYLALQQMRFGERLRYECRVDPELSDCLVPVLLLQPIVENAVVHGLDAGQASLTVTIDVVPTADGVRITVENDGAPVDIGVPRSGGHRVGLAATRARLITIHGDRASLSLTSRSGGGASVLVKIPRKTAERRMARESGDPVMQTV